MGRHKGPSIPLLFLVLSKNIYFTKLGRTQKLECHIICGMTKFREVETTTKMCNCRWVSYYMCVNFTNNVFFGQNFIKFQLKVMIST